MIFNCNGLIWGKLYLTWEFYGFDNDKMIFFKDWQGDITLRDYFLPVFASVFHMGKNTGSLLRGTTGGELPYKIIGDAGVGLPYDSPDAELCDHNAPSNKDDRPENPNDNDYIPTESENTGSILLVVKAAEEYIIGSQLNPKWYDSIKDIYWACKMKRFKIIKTYKNGEDIKNSQTNMFLHLYQKDTSAQYKFNLGDPTNQLVYYHCDIWLPRGIVFNYVFVHVTEEYLKSPPDEPPFSWFDWTEKENYFPEGDPNDWSKCVLLGGQFKVPRVHPLEGEEEPLIILPKDQSKPENIDLSIVTPGLEILPIVMKMNPFVKPK
jgi:hypothetical protein